MEISISEISQKLGKTSARVEEIQKARDAAKNELESLKAANNDLIQELKRISDDRKTKKGTLKQLENF